MIYFNKNTKNDIILTLRENSVLWNVSGITPFYLFQFTSENNNRPLYFTPQNISSSYDQQRFDEFYIIESGLTYQNLTANTPSINLSPAIFWNYQIYEQLNQYNLDPTQTISTVEVGKVFVSGYTGYVAQTYTYTGSSYYQTYQINP
jgi:hypothetical protein